MGVELVIMLGKGWILLGLQPCVMGVGSLTWVEYGLLGEMLAGFSKFGETGKIALLQDGMRGWRVVACVCFIVFRLPEIFAKWVC